MEQSYRYASVILEQSITKALDYEIPTELLKKAHVGALVLVPLRGKIVRGTIAELKNVKSFDKLLYIHEVITKETVFSDDLMDLAVFISKYYSTPLGKVIKTILPSGVRKNTTTKEQYFVQREQTREDIRNIIPQLLNKSPMQATVLEALLKVNKGILLTKLIQETKASTSVIQTLAKKKWISLTKVDPEADVLEDEEYLLTKPKTRTQEQDIALKDIISSLKQHAFRTHLLHGVTGSGKTEVYIQAIEAARKLGRGVIMLVPEIALTQQTIERFKSRFSEKIAILHYRMSDGKRRAFWDAMKNGEIHIVIGARSAIFSPIQNLGLIIVDEEHESSYKQQDDSPTYHARDIAIVRAKKNNATAILGSATPSLESYYNAKIGKYVLNTLHSRQQTTSLPNVCIVDMKQDREKANKTALFSDTLLREIDTCWKKGEQAILFLNRRGYYTRIECSACGEVVSCPHCDISLTLHKKERYLSCHLCGFELSIPSSCTSCRQSALLKFSGMGTEKIESILRAIMPHIRIIRIDRDSTKHKGSLQQQLHDFKTHKADVLIGTQMVAKGLHFPDVSLVGVLNCDAHLHLPDFRAQETTFQLITQVAGRAGRGETPGLVILQTQLPNHPIIHLAQKNDYEGFYQQEIAIREQFQFPPFTRVVKLLFVSTDEKKTERLACRHHAAIEQLLPKGMILHPVTSAGYPKIKNKYRFQFLIRGKSVPEIIAVITKAEENLPKTPERFLDVDPVSTFF